ncbi:putative polysaccharide biosynthesis protein [Enterococcus diestrammenae]|uniref:Polysaccharide biosynthesis protein n=1 Tax=Enterococcus diestrammenae TaxID=1155073 RepID=A0ABV0EYP7_9ENTE|nr:polysaccharide biosynthesis protein [Enterococcus diestrammenae]KAF1294720.1 polysaccharide biosynthesis protein [Enterococcus diestrammenae]
MAENKSPQQSLSAQERMARGSSWLTLGNVGSRLLGAIYVVPWFYWLGSDQYQANALFNMGYNFYALFLMISTAGIPAAFSKQTAHYNSLNEYATSRRLFKNALAVMAVFGAICSGVMYLSAPWLASISGGGSDLIPVIRSLSVAVLIIPCMSIIRGYFQGQHDMMPYAISQLAEQVARIFYMLLATFFIMKVGSGKYVEAVVQSTFAAFLGAIASILVLLYFFQKNRVRMDYLVEHSANKVKLDTKELILETIREAIPFIIIGTGITIFKLVDQVTFVRTMQGFTTYSESQLQKLFSIFSANPDKLTMVVIGLATSMASTGLPLITEATTLNRRDDLAKLISNNLQLFAFVMLPATFGMMVLAYPLNTFFYAPSHLGTQVLLVACIAGLFLGLYSMTSSMLQGMYENGSAIAYFVIGLLVKLLVQYPLIRVYEVYGPLFSTMIGFAVICGLNLWKLQKVSRFNAVLTFRRVVLIFLMSLGMTVLALVTRQILGIFLNTNSKMQSLVMILLVAAVGGGVYVFMALKTRLADKLLGNMADTIRRKLHLK